VVKPAARRKVVDYLIKTWKISQSRSCRLLKIHRKTYRYRTKRRNDDDDLRKNIINIANERRRFGYRRIHKMLVRKGLKVNHKKVYRIYKEENLKIRVKTRKRLKRDEINNMPIPQLPNKQWAMDFMSDSFASGRKFRILNVLDIATRECIALEVDVSIKGEGLTKILEKLLFLRGKLDSITIDNGSEFTSKIFEGWPKQKGIHLNFIQPGKSFQNDFIESFHGKFRDECLNESWFLNLK
jgi:putative transposase